MARENLSSFAPLYFFLLFSSSFHLFFFFVAFWFRLEFFFLVTRALTDLCHELVMLIRFFPFRLQSDGEGDSSDNLDRDDSSDDGDLDDGVGNDHQLKRQVLLLFIRCSLREGGGFPSSLFSPRKSIGKVSRKWEYKLMLPVPSFPSRNVTCLLLMYVWYWERKVVSSNAVETMPCDLRGIYTYK